MSATSLSIGPLTCLRETVHISLERARTQIARIVSLDSYERAQSLLQAVRFTYVFAPISTHERNVNTIGRLQDNIRPPARELSATAVLNTGELLQNPDNSVPHLGQSKLLTNANPRASIERNVRP